MRRPLHRFSMIFANLQSWRRGPTLPDHYGASSASNIALNFVPSRIAISLIGLMENASRRRGGREREREAPSSCAHALASNAPRTRSTAVLSRPGIISVHRKSIARLGFIRVQRRFLALRSDDRNVGRSNSRRRGARARARGDGGESSARGREQRQFAAGRCNSRKLSRPICSDCHAKAAQGDERTRRANEGGGGKKTTPPASS